MFSALLKPYLLAGILLMGSTAALAETGEVSAVGMGRDSGEATLSLLRIAVAKYFKDEPAPLTKAVLQSEILPNASSFVQSYKVLESRPGSVSISANVDLDVIRALFTLRAEKIGEANGAKALVVVKGARIPDSLTTPASTLNPYAAIELALKERLTRRQFTPAVLTAEELQESNAGDDAASAELLRGLGAKAEARIAVGVSSRYETFENENSHSKDERIVLSATMVDVKSGTTIGRSTAHVGNPKVKRDQYNVELQKLLVEESKDLLQELFVMAGKRFSKDAGQEEQTIVRVVRPENAFLVSRFRTVLESVKGVKSVLEFQAIRGSFDFRLKPSLGAAEILKGLKDQAPEDLAITEAQGEKPAEGELAPKVYVQLAAKVPAAPEDTVDAEGEKNAPKK